MILLLLIGPLSLRERGWGEGLLMLLLLFRFWSPIKP